MNCLHSKFMSQNVSNTTRQSNGVNIHNPSESGTKNNVQMQHGGTNIQQRLSGAIAEQISLKVFIRSQYLKSNTLYWSHSLRRVCLNPLFLTSYCRAIPEPNNDTQHFVAKFKIKSIKSHVPLVFWFINELYLASCTVDGASSWTKNCKNHRY